MGLVGSDGSPTELYREFRNPKKSRTALGKAFRRLYERLYEMNEYIHDADDGDVLGLIVECTGSEKNAAATKYTLTTFNMLRKHADFEIEEDDFEIADNNIPLTNNLEQQLSNIQPPKQNSGSTQKGINLSYTINLNLPATKDIEVFNAIFKSLKQHILDQ